MHRLARGIALGVLLAAIAAAPAAASSATTGAVLVKFNAGLPQALQQALLGGAQKVGSVPSLGVTVVQPAGSASALVAALNASPLVQYAELDQVMQATAIPNDPSFGQLYGIHNTGQSGGRVDADIDGPEGWDLGGLGAFPTTNGGVKVGIVDTGIRGTHEDLAGKTVNCAAVTFGFLGLFGGDPVPQESRGCNDDNGHGTHVAGTIAGIANNLKGVAGVAFNSPLAICKALSSGGSGSTAGVANCISYLVSRGAKVISMSLGGGASTTLQNAVTSASNNGALLVAAAGNAGNTSTEYPAGYAQVVSVAATDRNDARASFSNQNADVELAAAGVDVLSSHNPSNTAYATMSGTSMATPHVAGVAAVVMARYGTASATRSRLQATADDLGAAGKDNAYGYGRVNLARALS